MMKGNAQSNWQVLQSNTSNFLINLHIVSADTVLVAGDNSSIFRTVDGGNNWNIVYNGSNNSTWIYDIVQNGNTLIAVGDNSFIARSIDGGSTWTPISLPNATLVNFRSVKFLSQNELIATGGVTNSTTPRFYRSLDGGLTWNSQTWSFGISLYQIIQQANGDLFIGAWNGKVYKSINNGLNWTEHAVGALNQQTTNLAQKPNGDLFVNGFFSNSYYKYNNQTNTWSNITNIARQDVQYATSTFIDNHNGYMGGKMINSSQGKIYKTTTGGDTQNSWVVDYIHTDRIARVKFFNSNIGYAVGENGTILKKGVDCSSGQQYVISSNDTSICVGDTAYLGANNVLNYSWNNSITTSTNPVSPSQETNYIVTGTDNNGCISYDTTTVYVLPNINPTLVYVNGTLSCSQNYGIYEWYFNGVLVSNNKSFVPAVSGVYTFSIGSERCKTSKSIYVQLLTTIEEDKEESFIEIVNNKQELLIKNIYNQGISKIQIFDFNGKRVDYIDRYDSINNPSVINISKLEKGIYLIQFHLTNGKSMSKKFIKT